MCSSDLATNNIPPVHQRHGALDEPVGDDDKLLAMFADNVEFLRGLAVLIFNQAVKSLPDQTIDENQKINPLGISLDPDRWEADGLFDESGLTVAQARELAPDVEENWIDQAVAAR